MPGVLDSGLHVGRETVYGTPVAATRSYEAKGDGHKRSMDYLVSDGMRSGMHTVRSDRRRGINMGAAGQIELDVQNKGLGLLLQPGFGAPVVTIPGGGTNSRLHTYASSSDGAPGESVTVQMDRATVTGGALSPFVYHGGKVTKWTFAQAADNYLMLTLEMDFEDEVAGGGVATPVYPATTTPFAWPDAVVTVASVATDVKSFEMSGEMALDTGRRFIRGSALKKEPRRNGIPVYEGSMEVEFADLTEYNRFTSGAVVAIVATWTGAIIEGAIPFLFRLTMPACQYVGETPAISRDALPMEPLPFVALHTGAAAAVTLEYQTTDLTA